MFCPFCGADNVDGSQFCQKCGRQFQQSLVNSQASAQRPTPAPEPASSPEPTIASQNSHGVSCPKCGTTNNKTSKFCKKCGSSLLAGASAPASGSVRDVWGAYGATPPGPKPTEGAPTVFAPAVVSQTGTMPKAAQPSGSTNNKSNKKPMIIAACAAAVMLIVAVVIAVTSTSNSIPNHEGVVATSNDAFYTATNKNDVAQDSKTGISYADNEIIVYAAKGVTRRQVEDILASYNLVLLGYNAASNSYQFRVPNAMSYEELVALCNEIKALEGIVDAYINPTFVVADADGKQPNVGSQPAAPKPPHQPERVDSTKTDDPYLTWGLDAVKAKNAWNALGFDSADKKPGSSINVGILDDQFYADHKNLSGSFAEMNPSYADGFSAWYNSKSYLSSDEWKNSSDYDGEPAPDSDYSGVHGTHVAGIIAGSPNDQGVSGIAHGATLYGWQDGLDQAKRGADGHLKETSSSKTCYSWATALDYLVGEHDCKVVNISAGYVNSSEVTDAARDTYASVISAHMKALIRNGHEFVICVSAGNNKDVEALKSGSFSWINDPDLRDRIIVVGAAVRDDSGNVAVADYSSGGDRVDVIAPGSKIMSTAYTVNEETHEAVDDYAYMWGTSMATPMVAGAAALAFKANPDLSGAQVKQAICNTEGAQMLTGANGNNTPSRPMLDVSRVVSTAQSMTGEAGQLANKYNEEETAAESKKQETAVSDSGAGGGNETDANGNKDANNTDNNNNTDNKDANNKDANSANTEKNTADNKDASNADSSKSSTDQNNNKGSNAASSIELGSTNVDVSSDGQYIYFFGAGESTGSALTILPKVLRAPLTDVSQQETLWQSDTPGVVTCSAVGDDKLVFGVKASSGSRLEYYAMNKDGSGLQQLTCMCGDTRAMIGSITIHNGRIYYPRCTSGTDSITCDIRSCTLTGTDDRLLSTLELPDSAAVSVYVQDVINDAVCFSIWYYADGYTTGSAYTVSTEAKGVYPIEVAVAYSGKIVLAGEQFVGVVDNTLVSIPIKGGTPKTLATLGTGGDKKLDILGASPSHVFLSGSGSSGYECWYVDVRSGAATQLGAGGFGDGNFNIVGDNVYMTGYGIGNVTDLKLQNSTRVY